MSVSGFPTPSDGDDDIVADRLTDRERLSLARDLDAVGTFDFDMASRTVRWRQPAWRSWGQETGSIALDQLKPLLANDRAASVIGLILAAATDRAETVAVTCNLQAASLGLRRVEAKATIRYDDVGTIVALDGVMRDVTDAYRRERMLVTQSVEMAAILAGVPDAIVTIDPAGIVTRFNPAAVRLFGRAADAVIGHPFTDLIANHDDLPDRGSEPHVVTTRHADGRRLTVELRIAEPIDRDGDSDGHGDGDSDGDHLGHRILFLRDISDRIAIDARLAAERRQFAQATRVNVIGGFAAYLAHEVTQPLCAIANYIVTARALVQAQRSVEELADTLASADGQAQRARAIIRGLYDLTSRNEVDFHPVEIEQALHVAVELALAEIGRGEADIRFVLDPLVPAMLADPVQIQQVLVNLLRNAAQTPRDADGPRAIAILTRSADDDMVEISICDDGPGFSPTALADLFQPFGLGSGGGMGLGLSICRAIVEAHGGTIHADNPPTGGACVRFTVPTADQDIVG